MEQVASACCLLELLYPAIGEFTRGLELIDHGFNFQVRIKINASMLSSEWSCLAYAQTVWICWELKLDKTDWGW